MLMLFPSPRRRSDNISYRRLNPVRLFESNQKILQQKYRMNEEQLRRLCNLVSPLMTRTHIPSWSIEHENKVIIALRYLTSNSHQTVLSDCIGCSQKTISNAVAEFVTALNHPLIVRKFINFKPSDALYCRRIARGFTRLGRLPNIIGAIDGCCIPLRRPGGSGWQYYCRKGFTALNVLAIVDYRGKFLYINADYPGSVHDSTIYSLSKVKEAFDDRCVQKGYCLVSDSGFRNGNDVLTPIRNAVTLGERRYNKSHRRMRVPVECAFGRWKRRFSILESKIRLTPTVAAKVVVACAVLHNIMISMGCGKQMELGARKSTCRFPPRDVRNIRNFIVNAMS